MKSLLLRHSPSAATIIATMFALPAFAHPGHSLTDASATHLLASPFHLTTLAVIGGGIFLGARFVRGSAARKVMQLTGVVLLLTIVTLLGLRA